MRRAALLVVTSMVLVPLPVAADSDLQTMIDNAPAGSVVEVPAGTYDGPVVIDKPLTVRGLDAPVVDGGGDGNVFYVSSPDVVIEGFVIRNTGQSLDRENAGVSADMAPRLVVRDNIFENVLFGMFLRGSPDSLIAGNVVGAKELELGRRGDGIRLWESPNSIVEHNTISAGRDTVMWFTDGVVVRDNIISDGRYGLHFMYSDGAVIERNKMSDNSVGLFLMYSFDVTIRDNVMEGNYGPSGYGMGLKDMDGVTVSGNRFLSNRVGLYLDNSPSAAGVTQTFDSNVFAYNQTGVVFLPSVKNNSFTNNAFVDNTEQVGVQGSGAFSGNTWTVDGVGNFWSDFAGYDADADGIGDLPYTARDLFSELTDRHPELQFFDQTPAARAVGLAAHMFPVFEPRAKLTDTAPRLAPVTLAPPVGSAAGRPIVPTLTASFALLAAGGLVVIASRNPQRRPA